MNSYLLPFLNVSYPVNVCLSSSLVKLPIFSNFKARFGDIWVVCLLICMMINLPNCLYGQTDVPNAQAAGPLAGGSWLRFTTGGDATSIQENWGLNINGDPTHPVKISNASLLVGYPSGSQNMGQSNLFVSGRIGIGTLTPREALSVNGAIRAKSIKVETANWPDFVFDSKYHLLSLDYVKAFILHNKHLPAMPAAETIQSNGLDLGEMNKILLKKVEELTLYLIKQNDLIKVQNKRILKLETFQKDIKRLD